MTFIIGLRSGQFKSCPGDSSSDPFISLTMTTSGTHCLSSTLEEEIMAWPMAGPATTTECSSERSKTPAEGVSSEERGGFTSSHETSLVSTRRSDDCLSTSMASMDGMGLLPRTPSTLHLSPADT